MPHRTQDSRLLAQVLKIDKEYSTALNALLSTSQASLTALNAYASSCPPGHAKAMLGVVSALSGADEALKAYSVAVEGWRTDLKRIRRSEEELANVLRDREILVGKLVKATHKRSTRDSTGLAASFTTETPLGLSSHASGTGSTVTLTSGTAKLNHAQAELQACELHLAAKERDLESTREEAIKKGLERRLKALVSCGWAWGERGKQALRALDVFGGEHTNGGPDKHLLYTRFDPNDSQLSSVTPSQSASQIALPVTSDDSPMRLSSKPPGGSSSPLQTRATNLPEVKPEPTFELEIGPAHSIDDHGQIHESVPSSRVIDRPAPKVGENSDDEVSKMPLEVHENNPFGNRKIRRDTVKPPARASNETHSRTLRRPAPADDKAHASPRGVGFPRITSGSSQNKHASDLGPRNHYDSPPVSPREEGVNRHGSLARKRSTSFSLLGGFTGMFRGKKRSSSAERNYMPMSTGGWHTRTDKNLAYSQRGRNSSSEDELPSTLMRKNRLTEQTGDNSSVTGGSKRLTKRLSAQAPSRSRTLPSPETDEGSKYTVIERPPREELVRRGSHSKRTANLSTDSGKETARETAVNTAVNSGTTSSRRASMPPERPSWDATSQGATIRNRLQYDNGTNGLNTLENRTAELSKLSERLRRLEETEALARTAGGNDVPSMTLPPANLEVVKAPPSITQVPPLLYPIASTSYSREKSASPRTSSFKFPADPVSAHSGSPARQPTRLGSLDSYTPQSGGSNLKPRPSTSSKDAPLKSALKSPNRATAPLPSLPSILLNNHKRSQSLAGDTLVFPDRSGAISPPTPTGAREGLKPNGDSLFVPAYNGSNGSRTPPVTSSILVPTPRRLSEIPASARSSMAITDDDESVYESAEEELSGIEEEGKGSDGKGSDGTNTPPAAAAGNGLSNILGRMRHEEPGIITPSRSTPVSIGEGSHEGSNANASTSTSSASTQRRKSVRMIIYPTVALSPPERYADEPPTHRAEDTPPPESPAITSGSNSTIRPMHTTHVGDGGGGMEGWETRIDASKNAWDDSSEEDENYGRAKRALARASEPYSAEKRTRRA